MMKIKVPVEVSEELSKEKQRRVKPKAGVLEMKIEERQSKRTNTNAESCSIKTSNIAEVNQATPVPDLEPEALRCPIASCGNWLGKGYKKLLDHLVRSHCRILEEDDGEDKNAIVKTIHKLNRWICSECSRIKARVDENRICTHSWIKSLPREAPSRVSCDVPVNEKNVIIGKITEANRMKMELVRCIPQSLKQWWSRAVTLTLLDWLKASATKQTIRAVERWSKFKSVLVKPLRGGKKEKNRAAIWKW